MENMFESVLEAVLVEILDRKGKRNAYKPRKRYDPGEIPDLGEIRAYRSRDGGSESTKHGPQQYKKKMDRGMSATDNPSMVNKSRKDGLRTKLHDGQLSMLPSDYDGKRTTKKIGGRINSKTDGIVVGLGPGDRPIVQRKFGIDFRL